jgi:hypothetical protein
MPSIAHTVLFHANSAPNSSSVLVESLDAKHCAHCVVSSNCTPCHVVASTCALTTHTRMGFHCMHTIRAVH